jgi:hypothetical protein
LIGIAGAFAVGEAALVLNSTATPLPPDGLMVFIIIFYLFIIIIIIIIIITTTTNCN